MGTRSGANARMKHIVSLLDTCCGVGRFTWTQVRYHMMDARNSFIAPETTTRGRKTASCPGAWLAMHRRLIARRTGSQGSIGQRSTLGVYMRRECPSVAGATQLTPLWVLGPREVGGCPGSRVGSGPLRATQNPHPHPPQIVKPRFAKPRAAASAPSNFGAHTLPIFPGACELRSISRNFSFLVRCQFRPTSLFVNHPTID